MHIEDFSVLTDSELIIDLARVERMISETQTYARDDGTTTTLGTPVSPDLLALAEREQAITMEIESRRMSLRDWSAHRWVDSAGH